MAENWTGIIDYTNQAGFGNRFGMFSEDNPVQGMVFHHTAGGGNIDGVVSTFKKRGFPAQFVIDREGNIYQTLPEGAKGQHMRAGSGPVGEGKSNHNMEGVEIIARNDRDVLPIQKQAAAWLMQQRAARWGYDPAAGAFGHGEVNPGHKEADEGMSIVGPIRAGTLAGQMPEQRLMSQPTLASTGREAGDARIAAINALERQIYERESSSGRNISTSSSGARGPMQIIPSTFKRYAKPGESIDNFNDNRAVGRRIIEDLYDRYGGDRYSVLVGYNAGERRIGLPYDKLPVETQKYITRANEDYQRWYGEAPAGYQGGVTVAPVQPKTAPAELPEVPTSELAPPAEPVESRYLETPGVAEAPLEEAPEAVPAPTYRSGLIPEAGDLGPRPQYIEEPEGLHPFRTGLTIQPQDQDILGAGPYAGGDWAREVSPRAPNLLMGGAAPQARREAAVAGAGGPMGDPDFLRRESGEAGGGPSGDQAGPGQGQSTTGTRAGEEKEEKRGMMMLAVLAALARGSAVTPVNYEPFIPMLNKAPGPTARSALATSPLGKLTPGPQQVRLRQSTLRSS